MEICIVNPNILVSFSIKGPKGDLERSFKILTCFLKTISRLTSSEMGCKWQIAWCSQIAWSTYRNVLDTFFDDRWIEARKMREFSRADRLRRKSFVRLRCKQWTNACWRFFYSQMTLLLENSLPDINASQRWWSLAYDICIYTYTCIHMYLCVCMYVWIYVHVYICSLHNEHITKYACPTQSGWKGFASL